MKISFWLSRSLQTLIADIFLLMKFPLWKALKFYSANSNNVVWVNIFGVKYFMDTLIWDTAIINGLISNEKDYKIFFGRRVGKFHNKNILFSLNQYFDFNSFVNYPRSISNIIKQLENQGNRVLPNSRDVLFWENKAFMHKEFERLDIASPKSYLIAQVDDIKTIELGYPCLLKDVHSYHSRGVYKMDTLEQAHTFLVEYYDKRPHSKFIAQELLNIRKDIRVIIVGNEIVLHYWRINPSDEWQSTSTDNGSTVDFVSFPEHFRKHIVETFHKLGITTGAFDIAFNNDDLNSPPLFLEVSSSYAPNPVIDTSGMKHSYGELKRKIGSPFDKKRIDLIFDIKRKHISLFLNV